MSHLCNDKLNKEKRRILRKNQTDAERKMWNILRNSQMAGLKFYRQYSIGPYIIDFYCPTQRIAVEIDGGQHAEDLQKQHDVKRSQYLAEQGVFVVRFWNNEVMQNIEGVWEKIKEFIKSTHLD